MACSDPDLEELFEDLELLIQKAEKEKLWDKITGDQAWLIFIDAYSLKGRLEEELGEK